MVHTVSASVYDAIYSAAGKNYLDEASRVLDIIMVKTTRPPEKLSLLDVACGTGGHLEFLAPWLGHVEGADISEDMLTIARRRLPNVQFHCTDMRLLDIHNPDRESLFDVVTCLFSSIGYMTTKGDLHRAIYQMTQHLRSGGVMIVEPWLKPGDFDPERAFGLDVVDRSNLKVARIARGRRNDIITELSMHYTIAGPDGVQTLTEDHRLAMWTESDFLGVFNAMMLDASFNPEGISNNGRGVYVATKPK